MTTHINDGGVHRNIQQVHVNDGGVWRRINEIWVNDAGTWRRVFVGETINMGSDGVADSEMVNPAAATASFSLRADGTIFQTTGSNTTVNAGNWITPQINMANYEVLATVNSGSVSSGTVGSYVQLNVNRTWTKQQVINGTSTVSLTFTIRRIADGVIMDTLNLSMTATRLPP